jgi:hypothetical protein
MTQITSALALLIAALAVLSVSAPVSVRAQGTQITIAQPAEATTMDPGRSTQVLTVNYFFNLYDTLTRWDTGLKLVPGLATSWKSVNDTTWEFALRPGVKFHDGAPLTADDVKATIERNTVPGRTIVHSGFATIEAVEVVNPGTIRVITKKPDPLVPVRMAQMGSQILPARFTTEAGAKDLAKKPVGTGAYRFVEWVKDERLVMEANRDWWGWGQGALLRPGDLEAHPRGLPPHRRARQGRRRHHHQCAARSGQGHRERPAHARGHHARHAVRGLHDQFDPAAAVRQACAPGAALCARVSAIIRTSMRGRGSPSAAGSRTLTSATMSP